MEFERIEIIVKLPLKVDITLMSKIKLTHLAYRIGETSHFRILTQTRVGQHQINNIV